MYDKGTDICGQGKYLVHKLCDVGMRRYVNVLTDEAPVYIDYYLAPDGER